MTIPFFILPGAMIVFNLWVAVAQVYLGIEEVPLTDLESPEGRGVTCGFVLGYLGGLGGIVFILNLVYNGRNLIRAGASKLYRGGTNV